MTQQRVMFRVRDIGRRAAGLRRTPSMKTTTTTTTTAPAVGASASILSPPCCPSPLKIRAAVPPLALPPRSFSSSSSSSSSTSSPSASPPCRRRPHNQDVGDGYDVRRRGDHPYGSREYLLVENVSNEPAVAASLRAHRNVLFGAKRKAVGDDDPGDVQPTRLQQLFRPLVVEALRDASADGEQPQAMATLRGLCEYVRGQLAGDDNPELDGNVREELLRIANGERRVPVPLADGYYQDPSQQQVAKAWESLARGFVAAGGKSAECEIYMHFGAELVGIEQVSTSRESDDEYLQSSAGSMARFFFL